jgi:multidrug efflux pump subunit AcrA (membrane-fusion protein)
MQVRIQADVGDPKTRMLIDERAINSDQRGDFLYIVDDENKVEYRPVKLGIHVGSMRVIERGVEASDWVVVNGLQRAGPGKVVSPKPADETAANAGDTLPADESPADKFAADPQAKDAPDAPTDNQVK